MEHWPYIHWICLIPTFVVGAWFGTLLMALMVDAKAPDKRAGRGS